MTFNIHEKLCHCTTNIAPYVAYKWNGTFIPFYCSSIETENMLVSKYWSLYSERGMHEAFVLLAAKPEFTEDFVNRFLDRVKDNWQKNCGNRTEGELERFLSREEGNQFLGEAVGMTSYGSKFNETQTLLLAGNFCSGKDGKFFFC